MERNIKIFATPQTLAESMADQLANLIKNSSEPFNIAISGGNTPGLLFSVLGDKYSDMVNWNKVHFFWVDERCVAPDDPESNYGMTQKALLSKIEMPEENIHRIKGEENPLSEAKRYSEEIRNFVAQRKGLPSFNIILLGLGDDGHTASIFPGNNGLFLTNKICEVTVHPHTGQKRVTITGNTINNAQEIFFLVTGRRKANIVKEIFGRGREERQCPAEYVIPVDGKITWYLDKAAGSFIPKDFFKKED